MTAPIRLAWETPDADRVREVLRAVGLPAIGAALVGRGLVLRVVDGISSRLRAGESPVDDTARSAEDTGPAAAPRLVAVGIATVDLERAAVALGGLGRRLEDDGPLGARAALPPDRRLVLLEPAREGRLAATLARFGEGPAAIYLRLGRATEATARLRALGVATVAGPGPFGPEHLVLAAPPAGPHLVLLGEEGTPPSDRTLPPGAGARALPSPP